MYVFDRKRAKRNSLRSLAIAAVTGMTAACTTVPDNGPVSAPVAGQDSQDFSSSAKIVETQEQICRSESGDVVKQYIDGVDDKTIRRVETASSAAGFGKDMLIPPGAGLISAGINGARSAFHNISSGHVGAGLANLVEILPAAAAGFFGGGAAADATQGLTNEALKVFGADVQKLPTSDLSDTIKGAKCELPESTRAEQSNKVSAVMQKRPFQGYRIQIG